MKTTHTLIAFFSAALAIVTHPVAAAPGDLDLTFGAGTGKVTTEFFAGAGAVANEIAFQSDGKIVVVGLASDLTVSSFAVARYNTDGSLDPTFDGDGKVTTAIGTGNSSANGVAIQSDGKIVVVGSANPQFAIVRYNPNGSLDTSFNGSGMQAISGIGAAYSVAILSDGKIIVVGGSADFALARFNANGSLDTTFNGTGTVTTDFGNGNDVALDVTPQADGKIVVSGRAGVGSNSFVIGLARYNVDGSPDQNFNGTGKVRTLIGTSTFLRGNAEGVMVQGDGRIIVGGSAGNSSAISVLRYLPNGFPDLSFNGTGMVVGGAGDGSAADAALQSDGKVVLAGYATPSVDFAVWRFNPNGSNDTTFGGVGKVTTPFGSDTRANCVAIQNDGRILAAGSTIVGNVRIFALARYDGILPAPEIAVEQPTFTDLVNGSALVTFGNVLTGNTPSATFTIRNVGGANLTGLGITVDGPDAGDFSLTANPTSPVPGPNGSTTFTVRFAPASAGSKSAALHIASNDADEASFDIALTGRALAPSADDDGDTISNEAEMNLAALGFDPLVPDATTVALLRDNGLSAGGDLQTVALHRPVLVKDGATGHFHLSIGLETSPDLNIWTPLLNFAPTYNPTTGRIDLEFTPTPASTQFFRVLGAKP